MRNILSCAALYCVLLLAVAEASAQTRGIGDVVLIESKAARIDSNRNAISRIQSELPGLTAAWHARIRKLKEELNDLYSEMQGHLHDLANGFFCSECGRSRTQLENQGINFAAHLRDVRGRAVPASSQRLEQVRREYMQKIQAKQRQIEREEQGDAQIARRRADLAVMEEETPRLCTEITGHSRAYGDKILAEVRADQKAFAASLMEHVAAVLIAEDRIVIQQARKARLDREFARAAEAAREQARQQNLRDQERLKNRMSAMEGELERLRLHTEQRTDAAAARVREMQAQLAAAEAAARAPGVEEARRREIEDRQDHLRAEIAALEREIAELAERWRLEQMRVTADLQNLQGEIWNLASALSRDQEEAVARLRATFDQRKAAADALLTTAKAAVDDQTARFHAKANLYRGRVQQYHDLVVQESERMLAAGSVAGCAIHNDARQIPFTNWNQLYPCVSSHLMSKPRTENVFGSYCTGEMSTLSLLGSYRAFLSGLDPEDRQAVQANTNATWLERIVGP